MIKLDYTPQRNDNVEEYVLAVTNDILTVTINGFVEVFDFTGLDEGHADVIEVDYLPWNPIVTAIKKGDVIDILIIQFYNESERGEFEFGEDKVED